MEKKTDFAIITISSSLEKLQPHLPRPDVPQRLLLFNTLDQINIPRRVSFLSGDH
jgi:hypothetical protein